jgi:hypothetical protein
LVDCTGKIFVQLIKLPIYQLCNKGGLHEKHKHARPD